MKISSYLEDEQSYLNISQILSDAHNASILSLNFSNSLLRKRMIFKIISQRLQEYHQLRVFHLNIGFTYIPNSTMEIFLSGLSKCRTITKIKLDFQIDIFIKKRQDQKEDKKSLPNDKIAYLVADRLINCKNVQYISLNFSQIQQKEQDYKSFFKTLKNGHHFISIELILNNCNLDDFYLEQIGYILYENKNLHTFYLHVSNNNFKSMNSLFKIYIKQSNLQLKNLGQSDFATNKLQNFKLVASGFEANEQELIQFIQTFKYFSKLKSFELFISSKHNNIQLFTNTLLSIMKNLICISLNFNMLGDDQHMIMHQKNRFLKYWRKQKRIVCIRNLTIQQ
ncbi:hypothetical protein TTHERM_000066789 (macronuclear) [Tetrahymena thermophila SB210]|uniref:Kinase domain protein n=1 Tax=Tetrahymena thermophila (strain SB210) TaxID=312017 RepID=W7XKE6_TETTS|nr:hypothetical protein TTHERM_000066789 [Tetrahymena thermophila SB210]EWS76466.1 hypothetical protein TTHERM_000066789 [Tetrahymena thermophila SB210]|eukprot:XP_012651000.1 hypothetical protein TTHERM_000066789 [Tetrahymena thermophila SB210]